MTIETKLPAAEVLNAQRKHWEQTFGSKPSMFGEDASHPARVMRVLPLPKDFGEAEAGKGEDSPSPAPHPLVGTEEKLSGIPPV